MKFEVVVELKGEVLDVQGRAIRETLTRLGNNAVADVKVGKRFVLNIEGDENDAATQAERIAKEFLVNPVSETFRLRKL